MSDELRDFCNRLHEQLREKGTEIEQLRECIESLACQFGIVSNGMLMSGSLSAMEEAFEILGWDDPRPAPPYMVCDEPGCLSARSCGWPSPKGYRHTCGKHYRQSDE
uniref:Uncharacterized protein n=1 Tax=viral metagenome TaxID=1070528 RepID=A0A6M3IH71_9ZZZZ